MPKALKLKTKSTISNKPSTGTITEAYGDQRFFLTNGQVLAKLEDIPGALINMDDYTYNYHVNGDRNDLANWISAVFLDGGLAKKISKAKDRLSMANIISKNIR